MKRQVVAGMALSLVLPAMCYCVPQDAATPRTRAGRQITIRIHDYARVNPSLLLQAERAASDVLREAGVEPVWVACFDGHAWSTEATCKSPLTPLDLVLNLLPQSMARGLRPRGDAFGIAMETTGKDFAVVASVFYDTVKECAMHQQLDLAPLLGNAMAHELAHLLLGTHSHSSRGLMSASWSSRQLHLAEQRGLSFSASETERLRMAMTARSLAALGSADDHESLVTTNAMPAPAPSME